MPLETAPVVPTDASVIHADVVVIGAGPVGLFQVFQLGLHQLQAHVIDALPHTGGQCAELYGDKNIYDIPGIPACTGLELSERLQQQAAPFQPTYHLSQQVEQLQRLEDGSLVLRTSAGKVFCTRFLVLACGVGAFIPRLLKLDGATELAEGSSAQLFYHPRDLSISSHRQTVVLGGDESAVQAAIQCATVMQASSVTLIHRRDVFSAPEPMLQQLQELRNAGRIQVAIGQPSALLRDEAGTLKQLSIDTPDGAQQSIAADVVLAYLGISPKLGPIAEWGLELDRKQLTVDTANFATSEDGIYAVGDIVTYAGKRKLILCGFHEATLAAFGIAEQIQQRPVMLQYTSSSSHLQALLGVNS